MSKEVKNTLKTILTYAVLILMALVMLVPFAWMISASLKLEKDVFSYPIVWIPKDPVWSNYQEIWKKVPLLQGFFNTTKADRVYHGITASDIQLCCICICKIGI